MKEILNLLRRIDNANEIEKHGQHVCGLFISYWMLIRIDLFKLLNFSRSTRLHHENQRLHPPRLKLIHGLRLIVNAYFHRLKAKKAEVLFISSAGDNIDDDGYGGNIYNGLFAQVAHGKGFDVLFAEEPIRYKCFKSKKSLDAGSLLWSHLLLKIKYAFCKHFICVDTMGIERFSTVLSSYLKGYNDITKRQISALLSGKVRQLPLYVGRWNKLLETIQPSLIFMVCVFYGGYEGVLSLLCKKKGITVVEVQHGYIGIEHAAYFYGECLLSKIEFVRSFPDYFLIHGEKWGNSVNINTKKIVIGYPYLVEAKRKYTSSLNKYDILVTSVAEQPTFTIQRLEVLLKHKYKVLFRPHPVEYMVAEQRYGHLLNYNNFVLDCNRNVCRSVSEAKVIICLGDILSTIAYDALVFDKFVICRCTCISSVMAGDLCKDYITLCETDDNLIHELELILSGKKPLIRYPQEEFCVSDWKERFDLFLESVK